jgi:hypothetical protein
MTAAKVDIQALRALSAGKVSAVVSFEVAYLATIADELDALRARVDLVSHREAELHYAIRSTAPLVDTKLTENEAHAKAIDIVWRMRDRIDALRRATATARRALRAAESNRCMGINGCPVCCVYDGHAPGCVLQAALAALDALEGK